MKVIARLGILLLVTASLALHGWLAWRWQSQVVTTERTRRDLDRTERYLGFVMDSLGSTLRFPEPPPGPWGRDSVYWQWNAVTARLQSRRWQEAVLYWKVQSGVHLEAHELHDLMQKGLADPVADLRESLVAHPELIPISGVSGGTMQFDRESFVILNESYAFASFEDGHIGGHLLARFEVQGGAITWERVWSARE